MLVGVGDWLFWYGGGVGSNLGLFAPVWTTATLSLTPVIRRDPRSWIAAAGAVLLTVPLANSPSPLAFALFWATLTMTVLLPRAAGFDHAGHWALRLLTGIVEQRVEHRTADERRRQQRKDPLGLYASSGSAPQPKQIAPWPDDTGDAVNRECLSHRDRSTSPDRPP